jgi:hypothetical protein
VAGSADVFVGVLERYCGFKRRRSLNFAPFRFLLPLARSQTSRGHRPERVSRALFFIDIRRASVVAFSQLWMFRRIENKKIWMLRRSL